jgi:L-ribulose-5-phosphate 3-epimerase
MGIVSRNFSRRKFFAVSAQTAVFAGAFCAGGLLGADGPRRRFKLGACDWSLKKRADPAALQVAQELGLDGVQVDLKIDLQRPAPGILLRDPKLQQAYRDALRKTGLSIASFALSVMNWVPLKSDPRAAAWLADSLEVCRAMGVKLVMPACFNKGKLDLRQTREIGRFVAALRQVAPRAEKAGITIAVENSLSAEDNLKILERVGSPAVKVYYDVGNSADRGRDIDREIRTLGKQKLIAEFHFKDGPRLLGQGRIDFKKVRKAMDAVGYEGWIQLEAAAPHGLVQDYTGNRKYLREIFPE